MKKLIPKDAVLIPDTASKVFEGEIFDVYQWPQKMYDGSDATFEMLKRPDTVIVIPLVGEKVIAIEDEQPHSGLRLSFPGGRVDKGESNTLEAAKREVAEEIGFKFKQWKLVNVIQPHSKLEWFIYTYLAWEEYEITQTHLDAGEKITVKALSFDEAKNFAFTKAGYLGESDEMIRNIKSLADLLRLPEFEGMEVDR